MFRKDSIATSVYFQIGEVIDTILFFVSKQKMLWFAIEYSNSFKTQFYFMYLMASSRLYVNGCIRLGCKDLDNKMVTKRYTTI